MSYRIENTEIKSTPFGNGATLEFKVGQLFYENDEVFRYTRSVERVQSVFRITLQYVHDPMHIPYVFELDDALAFHPENEDAREIWLHDPSSKKRQEIKNALDTILSQDIEKLDS